MQQHPSPTPGDDGDGRSGGGDDVDGNQHVVEVEVTLESFASMHATGNAALLSGVRAPASAEEEAAFTSGRGSLPVAALGTLTTPRFDVPDFRHVPGLGDRTVVVSVMELAGRGLVVGFGPGTCSVTDLTTGDVVGEGRMRGGRYYLDYLRVPKNLSQAAS